MEVFNSLVLFALGFFVLIKGAQILVHGAVAIANIFRVSTWFIGTVLVSIGTSVPELSINVASVFSDNDIGIATIIGSNIFNVLFVLGFMAVFTPIVMRRSWVVNDLLVFILVTLLASLFILFPILGDSTFYGISRMEAGVFIGVLIMWLIQMFRRSSGDEEKADFGVITAFTAALMIAGGIIGVFLGGRWVVDGAVVIAKLVGVSPAVIGFTLVALGTSLPELVVSVVALSKGTVGIAAGNIVGSSIFNLLGVLGVTALIRPVPIFEPLMFDIVFVVLAALLWYVLMFVGRRYTLARWEGTLFLILYGYYVVSLFSR